MNKRASRTLNKLILRYRRKSHFPSLFEVEKTLWRAAAIANRGGGGYWFKKRELLVPFHLEQWTSVNLGWSFPCVEALRLIRRCIHSPLGRIIDVGAGIGLWTRALQQEFGEENVIGLDPRSNSAGVLRTTFSDWCEDTSGPTREDVLFASWLPCEFQEGNSLGMQILDAVKDTQPFVYIGSGSNGPSGTTEFHNRLATEFEEYATEPLPRIDEAVFPRDFIRLYWRKAA